MCIIDNCDKPIAPGSDAWLVGEICADHFKKIGIKIMDLDQTISQTWAEDFAKICVLLMSTDVMIGHIRELGPKLREIEGREDFTDLPDEDYKPNIHNTLQYYERKCWFSPLHIIPLGILTSDDFFGFIREGYVLDDFGAGYTHGGYTHRLQWFAIMRASTNRFTNPRSWNHSAFELYTELGEKGLASAKGSGGGGIHIPGMKETMGHNSNSIWGAMLDQPGLGLYFNRPDKLHHTIINGDLNNDPIAVAIKQHQRDWGQRAWSNFRLQNVKRNLDGLLEREQGRRWYRKKKDARQLLPAARQQFQNEHGDKRDGFLGFEGQGAFNQNAVRSVKEIELKSDDWVPDRAGALIRRGTQYNMDATRVGNHRTASRAGFARFVQFDDC